MAKYVYYNINPRGIKEEDCVTRAISFATGLDYNVVAEKLTLIAKLMNCDRLCVCCYRHLLDDIFKFRRVNCDSMTVNCFANKHPYGTYLVRMNGHISCIKNGKVYDIFDCRDIELTDAWQVNKG